MDKLDELEAREQKEYDKKKQAKYNTRQVIILDKACSLASDPFNFLDDPNFVILLPDYDLLDPSWSGYNFGSNTP
jgi:hypothetical protein